MPNEDYKKFLGTHPEMTVQVAKIYWEVENIDKRIGEMIQQLEEWGIADNTYSSSLEVTMALREPRKFIMPG